MSIEFIGYVSAREQTETLDLSGPEIDPAYIAATALIHERSGFDRVLVAAHSTSPDSTLIAQYAASVTSQLGLLIAHRPGFTAPTLAARQFATLDHITQGRVAVHIITGGNDRELEADGDHLSKVERYQRTAEYLQILRREWAGDRPFDHDGRFYRLRNASSSVLPYQPEGIPLYFGGASEEAIGVAGELADGYALWGEPRANAAELVEKVRSAGQRHNRSLRFSISFRPIIADTEEEAWERAAIIQKQVETRQATILPAQNGIALDDAGAHPTEDTLPTNEGSRRLQAIAAKSARHDERLWTGVAQVTGGRWNSTSLVGTADQVADSLLQYYRLGIETFLIRGFDPLNDAIRYGRDLIPRVRALVEQEDKLRHTSG
ncbi:alkanesulfonate monooxygenase [Gluconobacter thailandicus F149-1 = NBRC 100600]|uniref:Alkanesulfonate monooxygenase n=1 Tax=Gluconobacter thailandicus NBRC 3257 TaxID=1381097 RepID=A0ABQ0J190_GLUTH|nr:LLM class flavin-dependent oxidoreductase [Gluconobacter thailandicus]GAN91758.1 alkanesulfonate monooxygenase [Gluconobacter frateurii M-2]KXV54727.1 alkanesulfonate monooxygenase [Gluconobacter thailandicus]GAC89290.1 alkanesulfonate monooxygenase [Gluconobacter thailandicus NBRC 3255]GAD28242.1 alkanesulfonate monooxygenase [Gluconobacter thailandicus NBRC 3257]GAN94231.1 alkanesulfonate monooxygenase [Gluconobacter thailandicus F149-1 = NBRC 100600]